MNAIQQKQRLLIRVALGVVIGTLAMICSSGQACAQSSLQSAPSEWTNLIAPPIPYSPANPKSPESSSSPTLNNPLEDLRQPDPSGLLEADPPSNRVAGNTTYSSRQNRIEQASAIGWTQPGLRHRQLYFQDDQIERGVEKRQFPNVTAGAKFFKSIFAFPVRLVTGN